MTRIAPPSLTADERESFYGAAGVMQRLADEQRAVIRRHALPPAVPIGQPASPGRLGGAVIWDRLTPEQQAGLGACAIELAVARFGVEVARDQREEHLFLAAEEGVLTALDQRAEQHVFIDGVVSPRKVPGIPSLLGPICRQCGCTNHDAPGQDRGDSDSWAEPDLCRPCAADTQIRPRTAPAPEGSS